MLLRLLAITFFSAPLLSLAGVRHDLELLYPDQSAEVLNQRIANLKTKDDFFGAFIPYFYYRVRENFKKTNTWDDLLKEQSWCAGDPHPGNFGVLWTPKNTSIFTINDVDDANPCPVFVDVFRFLTGWSLADKDVPLPLLMNAYLNGLQSTGIPANAPAIQQLIAQSQRQGPLASSKWLNRYGQFKGSPELVNVSASVEAEIRVQALRLAGDQFKINAVKERLRFEGGSGGLKRFFVLLERNQLVPSQFFLLEMKEITRPGTFPLGVPHIDPMTRILQALQWEQAPVLTNWQKGAMLMGHPFLTRLLLDGNINLKIDRFSNADHIAIAVNEAEILGSLHRRGGASMAYAKKITNISLETWAQAVNTLHDEIEDAFKKVK